MAKEITVTPIVKNYKYTIFRNDVKYTIVDEDKLGDVLQSTSIRKSSQQTHAIGDVVHAGIAGLITVDYDVPYIGSNQESAFLDGVSEFYNNVVGSALQATDISHADLAAYIVLSHEWRAFVKDLDRVLVCYNQTSYLQPVYGKTLINAMTGHQQGYAFVKANSAQLIEIRNLICEKLATKFPCVKGSTLSAFDDMMLDNVYCDDPDAKSALIVAHRKGYAISVSADPLVKLTKSNIWNNLIVRWIAGANLEEFMTDLIDDATQSIWYTDVRPFIQNLINRGALQTEAAYTNFDFNVVNASWKPVYSTDFINFLKNVNIITERDLPITSWYFEETSAGKFHYHGIYVSPMYTDELRDGSSYYYIGGAIDMNKYFANMHSYPYTNEELIGVIVGAVQVAPGTTTPNTVEFTFDDTATLMNCCGGIVTKVTITLKVNPDGTMGETTSLVSNFVATIASQYGEDRQTVTGVLGLPYQDFMDLLQLNCLPKLITTIVQKNLYEELGIVGAYLDSKDWHPLNLDVDNMVEIPISMLRAAWSRYAYESVYASGASKMHNPLK